MSNLSKALGVWTILPRSLLLAAIALLISFGAVAQTLLSTNMYAWTLQNNSVLQSNLTNQMINLGGKPTSGSGAPLCLPPFDLQRGPAGVIPPALQGDPRFQEYLHCRKKYRGNNLAVAIVYAFGAAEFTLHATKTTSDQMHDRVRQINDAIAQSGKFARMSDEQKQSNADTWIFESAILNMLRAAGQRGDQQAVQQAVQLAQVMMQRLLAL